MFEQAFKNIDAAIWKDTGCDSELDYAEQSSWILFLKWLDDFEKDEETKAKLDNKKFNPIFKTEYRWSSWAVVKDKKGNPLPGLAPVAKQEGNFVAEIIKRNFHNSNENYGSINDDIC